LKNENQMLKIQIGNRSRAINVAEWVYPHEGSKNIEKYYANCDVQRVYLRDAYPPDVPIVLTISRRRATLTMTTHYV